MATMLLKLMVMMLVVVVILVMTIMLVGHAIGVEYGHGVRLVRGERGGIRLF